MLEISDNLKINLDSVISVNKVEDKWIARLRNGSSVVVTEEIANKIITSTGGGDDSSAISAHNSSSTAHSDIRSLVSTAQKKADLAYSLIDGSPKGVYANLSALQTAFPSGASGVYLTSDNGHWYYWNGSAWTDGGVYQSSEDVKQLKEDLVNESNKITTDHFDIFGDSDFTEHIGLLTGYDTSTFDATLLNSSDKYRVYRTLEIPMKNIGLIKIKCPSNSNLGVSFMATDLTTTMPSKFANVSATPLDLSGDYSKSYISHTSDSEFYIVDTKKLTEDGYKKMYVCYLAEEKPYIYCDENYKPKWLYDYGSDISELRKIIESGTDLSDVVVNVVEPQIYTEIQQDELENGKTYLLKVTLNDDVTKAYISLNSNGSSSSKFITFIDGQSLASGEHTYSFTYDSSITNQYLRLYLDNDSTKCSKFEIINPNASIKSLLDKKEDLIMVGFNMFGSIGAIGDSYTACSVKHSDGTWTKETERSYIATIGKRNGVDWDNYGVPGASTRTYLSGVDGDIGINKVLNANANDFYFFALGINDVNLLGLDYLGTIADIKSDYNNNPDTFYGNYARIIEKTKEHAPKGKFCMILPPFKNGIFVDFRNAIVEIANHYKIPYIDPFDDRAFISAIFTTMSDGHPTLAGYSAMGLAYERLFSKMVEKNVEYFRYATVG